MVEYLDQFLPFQADQGLPKDEILDLVGFTLTCECQKQLLVQGFDSTVKILNKTIKFCKRLEIFKGIYNDKDESKHPNKKD